MRATTTIPPQLNRTINKKVATPHPYGFNGMEKDDEVKGEGNSYTTLFRQYDPRIGRWLSLDPLASSIPWQSPYVAFDNKPIILVAPKGLAATGPDGINPDLEEGVSEEVSSDVEDDIELGLIEIKSNAGSKINYNPGSYLPVRKSVNYIYFNFMELNWWTGSTREPEKLPSVMNSESSLFDYRTVNKADVDAYTLYLERDFNYDMLQKEYVNFKLFDVRKAIV